MTATLLRQRPYPIRRDNEQLWVYPSMIGKPYKVRRAVEGGATAQTPQSQANAAQATLKQYLGVAPTKFRTILGTVPAASAGGPTANVTWQEIIPTIPAFCTAIEYTIVMPVTLTLPATTGTATLSPFAPYSAWANQFTLGGSPPWPLTEFTPWHIDETMHRVNYDPFYPGLGNDSGIFGTNSMLDQGPQVQVIGGSGSLAPGATVTNTTGSAVATNYTFTFTVRMKLQRKRHLLWGAIPFGDPENRPNNITQMFPLLGTLPEQSLFVNSSSAATCVLQSGGATVYANYELSYIDLLPPSLNGSAPQPAIGYGLQLTPSSPAGLSAGSLYPMTHRTAQIYTSIHHILVNASLPIEPDYFGLWDDQDQQSARWSYDTQANTFFKYFQNYHKDYRRYPYKGVFTCEFDDGVFPEVPSVTPYQALMSPDQSYATAFNLPVTPAMTTALRVPSSVTLSGQNYVRQYEFGLVRVPY